MFLLLFLFAHCIELPKSDNEAVWVYHNGRFCFGWELDTVKKFGGILKCDLVHSDLGIQSPFKLEIGETIKLDAKVTGNAPNFTFGEYTVRFFAKPEFERREGEYFFSNRNLLKKTLDVFAKGSIIKHYANGVFDEGNDYIETEGNVLRHGGVTVLKIQDGAVYMNTIYPDFQFDVLETEEITYTNELALGSTKVTISKDCEIKTHKNEFENGICVVKQNDLKILKYFVDSSTLAICHNNQAYFVKKNGVFLNQNIHVRNTNALQVDVVECKQQFNLEQLKEMENVCNKMS